jgi:hypothetical protein
MQLIVNHLIKKFPSLMNGEGSSPSQNSTITSYSHLHKLFLQDHHNIILTYRHRPHKQFLCMRGVCVCVCARARARVRVCFFFLFFLCVICTVCLTFTMLGEESQLGTLHFNFVFLYFMYFRSFFRPFQH